MDSIPYILHGALFLIAFIIPSGAFLMFAALFAGSKLNRTVIMGVVFGLGLLAYTILPPFLSVETVTFGIGSAVLIPSALICGISLLRNRHRIQWKQPSTETTPPKN